MDRFFIKKLTPKQLKEQQASIDAYNAREQARGSVPENPLTAASIRQIAQEKYQTEQSDNAPGPK